MQQEYEEVGRKITRINQLLSQTTDGDPKIPALLDGLGVTYYDRFCLSDEPSDIDKAIENVTIALSMRSDDDPDMPSRLYLIGTLHGMRFQRTGKSRDSEKALEFLSISVAFTPDGDTELPGRLANLGACHGSRYHDLEELNDLEKAIEYNSRAVALTLDDHPDLPDRLSNLGESHRCRHKRLGELHDLEKAIECNSHAVASTLDGHPDLPGRLANLGVSHSDRYERLQELNDLEKAIECESRAVALTPDGHPDLPTYLKNLGLSHSIRYKGLRELNDLERAIECESRAVALTSDNHPDLPKRLTNLALSHIERYKRLGELSDLEKAIECESRTVALTPDNHPDLPARLSDLGESLRARHQRLGELHDLVNALACNSRAVALTPDNHPELPMRLSNLGVSHSERYKRLGKPHDLEKAIEYNSRAVALAPEADPHLSSYLTNLGVAHSSRYKRLGELNDLEKSIEHKSRAVTSTPDSHSHLSDYLTNLGASHHDRYQRLGELNDLGKTMECHTRAIALLPDGHPSLPLYHFNQASVLCTCYDSSGDSAHLELALDSFRHASQAPTGPPRTKFNNAFRWAKYSSTHDAFNPVEAYQTTLDLLHDFIWLGATTDQRYHDLATTQTLAVDAARAAIRSSNYSLALEWLEQARCVVWSQILTLRSPLDRLQVHHPTLAARLRTVSTQLHSASSQSRESQALSSGSLTTEQVAQEHRRLAVEYNELIIQARQLTGFADFLRPMKAAGLIRAARYGPVAVINCHEDRCDALVILPGHNEVQHVPLPSFTGQNAQNARFELECAVRGDQTVERSSQRRPVILNRRKGLESMLADLWYGVVKPILSHLGYMEKISPNGLPHITWCPTGALSFLPFHAAGDYNQPRSKIYDYAISTYTTTVTALLNSTSSSLRSNTRVLAIGQEATPGHSPLPGTVKELGCVQAHVETTSQYTQLANNQATTSAVLDAMEQHDWVHFACHAHQNVNDPTKSGFFLHDGVLNIAAINQRSFKNKGLAFLSACQTATGDKVLPDEAIHLASGMLMAGYSSVIGTMWSVHDEDAPLVADMVYERLMRDRKLGNGEAGKALHNAVTVLRNEVGEKAFERWVPFIHFGS